MGAPKAYRHPIKAKLFVGTYFFTRLLYLFCGCKELGVNGEHKSSSMKENIHCNTASELIYS